MATTTITGLTDLGAAPATNDVTVIVDVSDTSQSPNGTTKKLLISELFTSVGITTALTVTGTLSVSSSTTLTGFVGVGAAGNAQTAFRVAGSYTAVAGNAVGFSNSSITLVASANNDQLRAGIIGATFTPGAFTGLVANNLNLSAFSTAAFTSPADPVSININIVTGTGATNAYGIRIAPPTGATNNYLLAHTTAATFNVTSAGAVTALRVIGGVDITSATALGVFSDNNYNSSPDAVITSVKGAVVSQARADGSGTIINFKTQIVQSAATTGAVYAAHNVAIGTHTSGTVANLFGNDSIVYLTGSGGTTTRASAHLLQNQIQAGAIVTTLRGLDINNFSISGTVGTAVGVDVGTVTGATNNFAIRTQGNDSIFNGTGSSLATNTTVGFVMLPNCAGAPSGVPANLTTGATPMMIDVTNKFLYLYIAGAWIKSTVYA